MTTPPAIMHRRREEMYHLAALGALLVGLYLPQLFQGLSAVESPEKMDVTMQWWPGRLFVGEEFRRGFFPLWNPELFFGMPFLAYAHGSLLYPVSSLLFTFLNYFPAATLVIVLHSLLGAVGFYFLLRELSVSGRSAFLAAVVWSQSGTWFHLINQFSNLMTTAYLPWVVLLLLRLAQATTAGHFFLLTALSALAVLAGDSEGAVYLFMFCFLVIIFFVPLRQGAEARRTLFLFAAALSAAFLLVAALSFPLLELSHHSIRSGASAVTVKLMPQLQGVLKFLPQLLAPLEYYREARQYSDFNHGLSPFYQGLLPVLLAARAAGRWRKDRENGRWLLILLCLLGYLWIMGLESLTPLTSRLPVLGKLSSRGRMLEEVQLIVLILFSRELDRGLTGWMQKPRTWAAASLVLAIFVLASAKFTVAPLPRLALAGVMFLAAATGFGLAWKEGGLSPADLPQTGQRAFRLVTLIVFADVTLLAYFCVPRTSPSDFRLEPTAKAVLNQLEPTYRFQPMYQLFEKGTPPPPDLNGAVLAETPLHSPIGFMRLPLSRSFHFISLANPGVLRQLSTIFFPAPTTALNMDITAMTNPDFISPTYLKLMNLAAVRYYISRGLSLKFSETYPLMTPNAFVQGGWGKEEPEFSGRGFLRGFSIRLPFRAEFESALYPQSRLFLEVAGLDPAPVVITLRATGEGDAPDFSHQTSVSPRPEGAEVSIPLSGEPGAVYRLVLEFEGRGEVTIRKAAMIRAAMPLKLRSAGAVDIYENPEAFPRAFILHRVRVLSSVNEVAAALVDEKTDLRSLLLLEQLSPAIEEVSRAEPLPPSLLLSERVSLRHRPQEVKVWCTLQAPGFLFLSDSYFPGWRAFEGSKEHRILRADLAFRAVALERGTHEVVFQYQPAGFRTGLFAGLTSWLWLISLSLFRRKNRKTAAGGSAGPRFISPPLS